MAQSPAPAAAGASSRSYIFDLENDAEWLSHLREQGFCVIRGAAGKADVEEATALLWRDIEAAYGAKRGDPETWKTWRLGVSGLVGDFAQSAGAWHVRGLPRVKSAFQRIWKAEDLIVSMDAIIAWRPWELNKSWRPQTEGLHLDQCPFNKPGLDCVQGMMPLLDVTPQIGGLEVVPCSHLEQAKADYVQRYPKRGDWCPLYDDDPNQGRGVLLCCAAGDLVLWDSRLVHGGIVGSGVDGEAAEEGERELARLTVTVAMTPRERASENVQRLRRVGFQAGESFNHCPHEAGTSSGTIKRKLPRKCARAELNEEQRALL